MPGLATFGREAAQLQTLCVIWLPPAAAAELGQLFQSGSFSSITKLVGICSHIPVDLPSGLLHLKVDVWGSQRQPADELIGNLSKLGLALQSLSINFLEESVLCSTQVLPPLQDLHIQLVLKTMEWLEWLRRQQTSRLHLAITISTFEPAMHAKVSLQSLPLHELRLIFHYPCLATLQVWQQLQLATPLYLSLQHIARECKLMALPHAPQLHINVEVGLAGTPVHLCWDAVTSRPGSVCITLQGFQPGCVLAVSGCTGRIPFQASEQPWQFCVHGSSVSVTGLPPSQPCTGATFLLQNRAAIAAGWTEET